MPSANPSPDTPSPTPSPTSPTSSAKSNKIPSTSEDLFVYSSQG